MPAALRRHWLDHRVPPPVVGLACALLAWAAARAWAPWDWPQALRLGLALPAALAGTALDLWALAVVLRAGTTVNPLTPERSARIVAHGPYRLSRNPMYLGMALSLCGWALWLAQPAALAAPLLFVAYVTRFQILPEERALQARFGAAYADYRRQVRRWL